MLDRIAKSLLITFVAALFVVAAQASEFTADYRKETLDNGAVVVCRHIPGSPLVTVQIRVLSGLSNEGPYAGSGISHFLEHLLFKGTQDKNSEEVRRRIKLMGGVVNGSTSLDSAEYHITVPKENFSQALRLLAGMVMEPEFTDEEFTREKEVILREIRLRNDDPTTKRIRLLFQKAYSRNVYGKSIIGDEDRFRELTRRDIERYHSAAYTPGRMVVGIAGGVEPEEAFSAARDIFSGYAGPDHSWDPEVLPEPEQEKEISADFSGDVIVGYLAIGFHTTDLYSDDLYPCDVMSILLGEGNDSRLYRRLVKDKRLLYSVSCVNYTPRYPGLFIITGIGDPSSLERAREEIFDCIEELKYGNIGGEELVRAKNMSLSDYLHSHERVGSVASSMTSSQILTGDPAFFERYLEEIKRVDAEDISRAASKYLYPDNSTTVKLLPGYYEEEGIRAGPPEDRGLRKAEKSEAARSGEPAERGTGPRPVDRGSRLEEKTREASRGRARAHVPPVDERFVRLENGMRIIVKRKGYLPLVSATLAMPGGLRSETSENNGISELTASLTLKGTKSRDESMIVPGIESMGGRIGSFSGLNSLGLTIDVMSDDLMPALEIMADAAMNSIFPEKEIEKQKEKTIALIQEREKDIFQRGVISLRSMLYGSHPYSMKVSGDVKTVSALTREEMLEYYSGHFSPSNAVLTVVGDVDPVSLSPVLAEKFSDWTGKENPLENKAVEPLEGEISGDMAMRKEQALFMRGFLGVRVDDERKYALSLASSILSGSDGLLFTSAREKEGLTYASGAVNVPEVDRGYFIIYIATTEGDLGRAGEITAEVIGKLKRGDIDAEEIRASKNRLIVQRALSLETNSALSMIMALDELYGLSYRDHEEYAQRVEAVSKKDLVDRSGEFFDLDASAAVSIHSEEGY